MKIKMFDKDRKVEMRVNAREIENLKFLVDNIMDAIREYNKKVGK